MDAEYRVTDGFINDGANNDRVFHGFFTRNGGVSTGIYRGLNCGSGSNDDPEHVIENRTRVANAAGGIAEPNLLTLYQVHGNTCIIPSAANPPYAPDNRPKADAHVTDQANLALGILTADCAPVLFYGQKTDGAPVIGAAHAGWGGAFKGILQSTISQMLSLGAQAQSIRASIGPCITQKSYEVGAEFIERFYEQDEDNERFFKDSPKSGHYLFDLGGYCAQQLQSAGVQTVILNDWNTYSDEDSFYSYRRTTHRGEADYGRQISVIMIRP